MMTYAVQHPDMSHALLIESEVERTESGLKAYGSIYVMQNFDAVLAVDEFEVREVPNGTDEEYSIFAEVDQDDEEDQ